jgi:hypothetical protein
MRSGISAMENHEKIARRFSRNLFFPSRAHRSSVSTLRAGCERAGRYQSKSKENRIHE